MLGGAERIVEAAGLPPRHRAPAAGRDPGDGSRAAWSTRRTTSAWAPSTSPNRTWSAPSAAPHSAYCASRSAAGMVLRGYDGRRDYWERMHRRAGHHRLPRLRLVLPDRRPGGATTSGRWASGSRARGSGAGSLVNHLLGITSADPVEHGLLMERFLSKRRAALPDIDIDVESARRLEVYRAIFGRFGAERVATVAMPETYRVRHAIRDVGAALSLDPAETDRLAKAFPHIRARDARAAMEELPELRAVAAEKEKFGRLWELVEALDALPRGVAMHPCGVLLSDASLLRPYAGGADQRRGLSRCRSSTRTTWRSSGCSSSMCWACGCSRRWRTRSLRSARATGERLDLDDPEQVPAGRPGHVRLIRSAETLGCFQIESPGQRDLVGRLQPANFHDLVVDISLFRPGPVAADMVRPFIEARHGRRRPRVIRTPIWTRR